MTNRKLARHVTVAGITYPPGGIVPANVAEKITNPKAWMSSAEQAEAEAAEKASPAGTSSGHTLVGNITIAGRTYGPGDHIPDEVAVKIRNPKAWKDGKVPGATAEPSAEPAASSPEPAATGQQETGGNATPPPSPPPPPAPDPDADKAKKPGTSKKS